MNGNRISTMKEHDFISGETPLPPAPFDGKVILASGSPRRRELLRLIVPEFDIAPSREVNEDYDSGTPAEEISGLLSLRKSMAYDDLITAGTLLITADTLVICDGRVLGKPHTPAGAAGMLRLLSGRAHTVVTGVTLATESGRKTFSETTLVHFSELNDSEIEEYISRFRPFDKAGAYGIQEWIGCIGIRGIDGCFYNVMGLPLHTLYHEIRKISRS